MKIKIVIIFYSLISVYFFSGEAGLKAKTAKENMYGNIVQYKFVKESDIKSDLLQMLANFSLYMKNDFIENKMMNSVGEKIGCFGGEDTMGSGEAGVRTNADLSMVCAFMVKYGKGKVALPNGVSWNDIEKMAMESLTYSYSSHKANKLVRCRDGKYWGSISVEDYTWESSLWAMSAAYSAFFQWDKLSYIQKKYIENMLKSECNYELHRSVPTCYDGDTKAEENAWEVDVLAVTLGLCPNDSIAPYWFDKLRAFAINSYSHIEDSKDKTIIDPLYDNKTVADFYVGKNLYDDYTLQNHNFFHTSYQNVVIQELGEAALAMDLFQKTIYGNVRWKTNALMHNNSKVMTHVLNWLALADGELAMPNGNDWSLFLYDQITSYTTNACFLRDPDALMLENLAYRNILKRQQTTEDGSWLLRPDVGARRMGVEAHRVMMTWLMHDVRSTNDIQPTNWIDFRTRYSRAKLFDNQNIVRAYTKDRFTCFSWSSGIKSYTGYIGLDTKEQNKIIVPFKDHNTGNFIGWYDVDSTKINAVPVIAGIYKLKGNSYTMNGELLTNDKTLDNRFSIYSTPGNAIIYLDYVVGLKSGVINKERGGLMAISTDQFTKISRNIYSKDSVNVDGNSFINIKNDWVNIDNLFGVVCHNNKNIGFGDNSNNNSIMTSKLYAFCSDEKRPFSIGKIVDRRNVIYYSKISSIETKKMSRKLIVLKDFLPSGWNGVIAPDPDGRYYMLLSNFNGKKRCRLYDIKCELGAPIFGGKTSVYNSSSSASFLIPLNHSESNSIDCFVEGSGIDIYNKQKGKELKINNMENCNKRIKLIIVKDNGLYSRIINVKKRKSIIVPL